MNISNSTDFTRYTNLLHALPGQRWGGNQTQANAATQSQSVSSLPPLPRTQNSADRFAVIGDSGTEDWRQTAVAQQLSYWYGISPFQSVLMLGDNVYPAGNPAQFQDRIANPYADLFQHQVRFLPVLGNHDVKAGFGNWQLAYWGVPPYYHYKLGPKGSEVEFWAIDTNLMTPGLDVTGPNNDSLVRQQKAACQLQWLEQTLANSSAAMKVLYAHHPLYSRGADTKPIRAWQQAELAKTLAPLLAKYDVDLYMSGHEHHYEKPRLVNGTYHLVSGAGGNIDSAKRGGAESSEIMKQLHFMMFDITPEGLSYQTVSLTGQILDQGLIPKRSTIGQRLSMNA